MSAFAVLDAPSNLGLRPPAPGREPGCRHLPEAMREQRLLTRLSATDAGAVVPPAYHDFTWQPGGVRHAAAIGHYSRQLADRLTRLQETSDFPVVLGGDCSILLGIMLSLRRRGRYGLVCLDGPDFRHPGNSTDVGGAAGESLALVTGRGGADLTDLDGLAPYVRDEDVALIGMREDDEFAAEVGATLQAVTAGEVVADGPTAAAARALETVTAPGVAGFWVHLDADVLDPSVMPAVDTPEPGGLGVDHLREVLTVLLAAPGCIGFDLTIYDPHLDPDRNAAATLTDTLVAAAACRGRSSSASA